VTNGQKQDIPILAKVFSEQSLDDKQRRDILNLAREAIREYLTLGSIKHNKPDDLTLAQNSGVFVTLWSPPVGIREPGADTNEKLRGCVGRVEAGTPLYVGIRESAVSAATKDPRFLPVTIAELETLRIEVALLSTFREINDLQGIVVGEHGLMIVGQGKRGLLLPKVAKRMGWSRHTYFRAICEKAGLPYNCWPGDAALYSFTAVTAEEK